MKTTRVLLDAILVIHDEELAKGETEKRARAIGDAELFHRNHGFEGNFKDVEDDYVELVRLGYLSGTEGRMGHRIINMCLTPKAIEEHEKATSAKSQAANTVVSGFTNPE